MTSPKVKAALEETMKFRWEVAKTQRDVSEVERQLKVQSSCTAAFNRCK